MQNVGLSVISGPETKAFRNWAIGVAAATFRAVEVLYSGPIAFTAEPQLSFIDWSSQLNYSSLWYSCTKSYLFSVFLKSHSLGEIYQYLILLVNCLCLLSIPSPHHFALHLPYLIVLGLSDSCMICLLNVLATCHSASLVFSASEGNTDNQSLVSSTHMLAHNLL